MKLCSTCTKTIVVALSFHCACGDDRERVSFLVTASRNTEAKTDFVQVTGGMWRAITVDRMTLWSTQS